MEKFLRGGVARPLSDLEKIVKKDIQPVNRLNPGVVPRVKKDANAHTKSVAEAIGNPKLGHRLSTLIPPPEFDREQYMADPETYLTTVEPGRVRQFLEPSPEVEPIRRTNTYFHRVLQGETVVLEVAAEPGMPVTYYSARLGQFENQLGTITVAADENGTARADFKVSTGTRGDIDIFAASPVHSGQTRFLVSVVIPETTVATNSNNQPTAESGGQ